MTINVRPQLTLEKILSRVDEMDIYRRYIGDVKIKQMISSPLRSGDSDPSFRLYPTVSGNIRYVDYGTGQRGGVIDLVWQIYPYMTYGELLERIWEDVNGDILPPLKQSVRRKKVRNGFPEVLVKKRRPNENDIAFWSSFGISKETLNWGRVYPISRYWIDGNMYGCRTLSYAYDLFTEWKIYRPNETKMRFIAGGTALQGYRLLPKEGETCIIQKSYKDVLLMHEFGIPSFAPQAESVDVRKDIIDDLQRRFDRVYIWGDNDDAGCSYIERHVGPYDIIPLQNSDDTKDITDHAKRYGKQSAESMVRELLK